MSSSKKSSSKKYSKKPVEEEEEEEDVPRSKSSFKREKDSGKLESSGRLKSTGAKEEKSSKSSREKGEGSSKKSGSKEVGESSKDTEKGRRKSSSKEKGKEKEVEEETEETKSKSHKNHKSHKSSCSINKKKGEAHMLYAFVTRGQDVLAECSTRAGDYAEIAKEEMASAPTGKPSFTIPHGDYNLNFDITNGLTYMVLSDSHLLRETSLGFLERVKEDFPKRYSKKMQTAKPGSLTLEYGPKMIQHMEYVLAHPEEMSKTSKIKAQVAEVKGVMQQNIQKALQRGEKLEVLQEKSDLLENQAALFKKQGGELQTKFWLENMKMKLMILGGLFLLAAIFLLPAIGIPHFPTYTQIGGEITQYERGYPPAPTALTAPTAHLAPVAAPAGTGANGHENVPH